MNRQRLAPMGLLPLFFTASTFGQGYGDEESLVDLQVSAKGTISTDVDGDGLRDALLLSADGLQVRWLRNAGPNRFVPQEPVLQTTDRVDVIFPYDVDSDGDEDLLCGGASGAMALSWVENTGGGTFGARTALLALTGDVADLAFADLNGDGAEDLALRLLTSSGVGSIWWAPSTGGGTTLAFGTPQVLSGAPGSFNTMVLADVDGDGDQDLFASNPGGRGRLIMHENRGSLGLALRVVVIPDLLYGSDFLAIDDFTGDGIVDIVTSGRSLSRIHIFRGFGGLGFASAQVMHTGSGLVRSFAAADLNGDGNDGFVLILSDGYGMKRNIGGVLEEFFRIGASDSFAQEAIDPSDLDGDGDVDALAIVRGQLLHLDNYGGGLSSSLPLGIYSGGFRFPDAADLDGDGDADLAYALNPNDGGFAWAENLGDGRFGAASHRFGSFKVSHCEARDVDLDGDMDIFAVGTSLITGGAAHVGWAENRGGGDFSGVQSIFFDFAPLGGGSTEAWLADMEGDGDLDALVTYRNLFSHLVTVWAVGSPGGFTQGPTLSSSLLGDGLQFADLNGDGAEDALYFRFGASPVVWRANDGAGGFGPERPLVQAPTSLVQNFAAEDLDGDGDIDMVTAGPAGSFVYLNQGAGILGAGVQIHVPSTSRVLVRDADLDGLPDVFMQEAIGSPRLARNLGGGSFAAAAQIPGISAPIVEVADFDGDLDLDLFRPGVSIQFNRSKERFGVGFCGPAAVHSGGESGTVSASGSQVTSDNDVLLHVERMPLGTFGIFVIGTGQGFVSNPGGSQGNLCLGGSIGRLMQSPGQIFMTGTQGAATVPLDLTRVPTPHGLETLLPGDTRYVQAWFRDSNPTATSNFTSGLALEFE